MKKSKTFLLLPQNKMKKSKTFLLLPQTIDKIEKMKEKSEIIREAHLIDIAIEFLWEKIEKKEIKLLKGYPSYIKI